MNLNHKTDYQNGDTLSASAWNALASDVNELGAGGSGSGAITVTDETAEGGDATVGVAVVSGVQDVGSPKVLELTKKKKGVNTTLTSENNINIEPRASVESTKGGNISFKPGDDIEFCSHHRLSNNQDEVSMKIIDGDDNPVKLQLNASEITLTTKDKTGNNAAVMDVTVNSAKNTRGYLKVRAQAIDLRSESHGGIALQPKGVDGDGNENKIKFEHGGGDGLEFGTFNTLHTSLFTNDYRFKKDGVIRLSQRYTTTSDKADPDDATTLNKFQKNNEANNAAISSDTGKTFNAADDFYDFVETSDPTCTWEDIVTIISELKTMKTNNQGPWTQL